LEHVLNKILASYLSKQ